MCRSRSEKTVSSTNRNNSQRKPTRSRIEKFQILSFELESIESKKNRSNRWQIDLNSQTLTLTLEIKGRGTYLVRAPLPSPVRVTRLRRRSPDFAAQWSRPLAAPGHRGRVCGARKRGYVHGRLDGGALTLWRAHAPASKPRRRRPARSPRPPWPVAVVAA